MFVSVRARAAAAPVFVSLLVAVLVVLIGATACAPRPTLAELDRRVYGTSLPAFATWWRHEQAVANGVSDATIDRWVRSSPVRLDTAAARRRPFDVSTDLCSFAPDAGPSFDFRWPCIRHDFAWRNLHRLEVLAGGGIDTRARRVAASRQFGRDLRTTCDVRPPIPRTACRAVAAAYERAVLAVS